MILNYLKFMFYVLCVKAMICLKIIATKIKKSNRKISKYFSNLRLLLVKSTVARTISESSVNIL